MSGGREAVLTRVCTCACTSTTAWTRGAMWSALVLSRRGLRRGARSRPFALRDLEDAQPPQENVYVDVDADGLLVARGGVARAVLAARLADAPPHADALLCATTATDARLQLRLAADAPPLSELRLWFDEHTLALLDMPFLTLRNISAKESYVCHVCGAEFEQPNPLKLHLFLSCGPAEPAAFWHRAAQRLRAAAALPPPPPADPARLEALAAAWGRSHAGHVCVYCGKLYSRRYGLKIHIRTHTGYKPLRCRHCLRAFGDPSNLNKHVRLHATPSAPSAPPAQHACPLCRKPLARRRDLLRHVRAHHAATPPPPPPPLSARPD